MAPAADVDVAKLHAALDERVDGEVRFDPGTLGAYAQDASNYRQVPIGVVVPRTVDAAEVAVAVCRGAGAPVLSRGGGTSLAGQCVNAAVVIDWTKYCHRLVSVDVGARTAIVQPGMALDKVNDALAPHGLMVGPKPSTHVSCTIGGMIGNNSCGSTAQAYGKMADSVRRLEVLTYGGLRTWVGETSEEEYEQIVAAGGDKAELYRRLRGIRDTYLGAIRTGYPKIPRRVSGYNLDQLLPENGFHVARAVVGSESTLVTVLHAELELFEVPRCRSLVVLGYPDIADAADLVPKVIAHKPLLCEGLDDTLISLERAEHLAGDALDKLPEGSGWLMVGFGGDTAEEADAKAHALIKDVQADGDHPKPHVAYTEDPAVEDKLSDVREAGLGATAYPPGKHETHEGWEDAAVPPDLLGDYLRDFRKLLEHYDYRGASLYGHFGQGCVHTRIPFELRTDEGGVMCPSYRVTREEEHSTRGRSRLLMEMVRGEVVRDGWHSGEVLDALDLCLACKGCRKDCPVEVDMATYKAEFLAHHYKGRLRPAAHYSMGWLPVAALLATRAPGLVSAAGRAPLLGRLIKAAGGIDQHRELPAFARERFTRWHTRRGTRRAGEKVILWPDTFTNSFHPEVGKAAVTVLEDAGFSVEVPVRPVCCGLTWISTGQLGVAAAMLRRTIRTLRPQLQAGTRVVVLEPSCAAVFRSDAADLLGSDDARLLARQTRTLAEVLTEAGWHAPVPPVVGRRAAIAQVHCHQHAIMGFDADTELLKACGVDVDVLDSGCCGLAGNFGSRPATTRCPWPAPSTGCGRPSGTHARRPPCWPTGSPAAPRSRPATSAGRASTWPSCSPS